MFPLLLYLSFFWIVSIIQQVHITMTITIKSPVKPTMALSPKKGKKLNIAPAYHKTRYPIIIRKCLQITAASLWQFLLYFRAFA